MEERRKPKRLSPEEKNQRAKDMFLDWYKGMTHKELAVAYNLNVTTVAEIASLYQWKKTKEALRIRAYAEAMLKIRGLVADTTETLIREHRKIVKKAEDEKRLLTTDEATLILRINETMRKEIRLEDNKPTEISSGPSQVKIVLTGGMQDYGMSPDTEGLQIVHEEALEEKLKLDHDELEAEVIQIEDKRESDA